MHCFLSSVTVCIIGYFQIFVEIQPNFATWCSYGLLQPSSLNSLGENLRNMPIMGDLVTSILQMLLNQIKLVN